MDLNWHLIKLKFPAKLVLTLEIVRRYLELGYIDNICITCNRMVATPKTINFVNLNHILRDVNIDTFFATPKSITISIIVYKI